MLRDSVEVIFLLLERTMVWHYSCSDVLLTQMMQQGQHGFYLLPSCCLQMNRNPGHSICWMSKEG